VYIALRRAAPGVLAGGGGGVSMRDLRKLPANRPPRRNDFTTRAGAEGSRPGEQAVGLCDSGPQQGGRLAASLKTCKRLHKWGVRSLKNFAMRLGNWLRGETIMKLPRPKG
jgi:hypothetical protein